MPDDIARDALIAYLVQYLGLGLVFFVGLIIAIRQGDIGLKTKHQKTWLAVLLGGYVFYAVLHGTFQFVFVDL